MVIRLGNWFLTLMGCIFGYSLCLTISANSIHGIDGRFSASKILWILGGPVGVGGLFLIRIALRGWVSRLSIQELAKKTYFQFDNFTYMPFGFCLLLGMGFKISIPTIYLLLLSFFLCQAACLLFGMHKSGYGITFFQSFGGLGFLFLISGMAALIYEIIWQRMLFSLYGINIESVTIIVSLFMFGLGMGSLGGGLLSRRFPLALPYLFSASELVIGIFGVFSLQLMNAIAARTYNFGVTGITLTTYALLSIPTFFMGATLPILVTFVHKRIRHIGNAVSMLYFFNTLGSAVACFITVDFLFVFFGRQATIWIAASLNLFAAITVLYLTMMGKEKQEKGFEPNNCPVGGATTSRATLPFEIILIISGFIGLLSLSQEILWVRVIGYNAQSAPQVFGQILGCFLIGIALGSKKSRKYCANAHPPLGLLAGLILAGSLLFYAAIPITANLSLLGKGFGLIGSYLLVGVTAFLFGHILPILCHYGIKVGSPVGIRTSWIYVANIIGSTGGPLLMGFVLLEHYPLSINIRIVVWAGLFLSLVIFWLSKHSFFSKAAWMLGMGIFALLTSALHENLFAHSLEKLHFGSKYSPERNYKYLVQNRSGILAVRGDAKGDIIFGGGAYDGRFSTDPVTNFNGIRRVFMLAALHPNPATLLEIGLSSGSWTQVAASNCRIKKIDVVEINPGYGEIIRNYPENAGVLSNPKINLHIDDGRRWLKRNPAACFDFILMNTTFHWRSNSTNLLSREFLTLAKKHLLPGGVLYYNTTGSREVVRTAAEVFKHVVVYSTFVAASDDPFSMSPQERAAGLLNFRKGSGPVLDTLLPLDARVWREMYSFDLKDVSKEVLGDRNLVAITDDNMLTEFKRITDTDAIGYLYSVSDSTHYWKDLWRKLGEL